MHEETREYVPPEDLGINSEELKAKQEELLNYTPEYLALDREKPHAEYIIFDSLDAKEVAKDKIKEYREHDEAFTFLTDWKDDNKRPDVGIELSFSKSPTDNMKKVKDFFERNSLSVKEIYYVEKDDTKIITPTIKPTEIVQEEQLSNVVEFPKPKDTQQDQEDTGMPKAA